MRHILTAQAGALDLALAEAGHPVLERRLEPGVALCAGAAQPKHPVFLRHLCPAQAEVALTGAMGDVDALLLALRSLLPLPGGEGGFSVQTRILEGFQPAYKRFDVNTALAGAIEMTGAVLNVKAPSVIVSVTLAEGMGFLGVSTPEENLSGWAGGARRFKWEEGQISRAEFKLLEACEVFGLAFSDGARALDLGAAPGGWTRVLRRHGLYVTAVDPAELDARLKRDKRITHFRGTAQAYFQNPDPCDVMVNDMKMDAEASAALMAEGARCLKKEGAAVLTLKLPDHPVEWPNRVRRAEAILRKAYSVREIRQLFHNRNEVTAYLTRL